MKSIKITIIDYDVGNVHSVYNAISKLGYKNINVSSNESQIKNSDCFILPGVGAFNKCIENFKLNNLDNILGEEVLVNKKPLLGICVGMQILATYGTENGYCEGLDWIPGIVDKIELKKSFRIPHVGWNSINLNSSKIFSRLEKEPDFYFDHSYSFRCDEKYVDAKCNYGSEIISAVSNGNIFGVQFHPEKSQNNGLKLFRGFFNNV